MPALIVEDGTAKTDASTYGLVATVITELDLLGDPATWVALSVEAQEDACRSVTLWLDRKYRGLWKGDRKTRDQGLAWPRVNGFDEDNFFISSTELPKELVTAHAVMCGKVADGESLDVDQTVQSIKSEKVQAGPVMKDVEYTGSKRSGKKYPTIDEILAPIITNSYISALGPAFRG